MATHDLVPVFSSTDPNQLEVIKLALEGEGIPATIEGEHQAGLTGIIPARLLVRAEDVARARSVIRAGGHEKRRSDHAADAE